jgi:hypothetical protein
LLERREETGDAWISVQSKILMLLIKFLQKAKLWAALLSIYRLHSEASCHLVLTTVWKDEYYCVYFINKEPEGQRREGGFIPECPS